MKSMIAIVCITYHHSMYPSSMYRHSMYHCASFDFFIHTKINYFRISTEFQVRHAIHTIHFWKKSQVFKFFELKIWTKLRYVNPSKAEFTIVIFIHYIPLSQFVVDEDDLKWVENKKNDIVINKTVP